MKRLAPTKLLTKKQREHLKEAGCRCTVKDVTDHVSAMKEANPDKVIGQVCRECADIARRLGVAV